MKVLPNNSVVDTRERVDVKGIKHKDPKKQKLEVGKVYSIHPLQAQNLIETGHAEAADGKTEQIQKSNR